MKIWFQSFDLLLIQVILSEPEVDQDECEYELEKRTTAVFYSITSTQKGTYRSGSEYVPTLEEVK